MLSLFGIFLPIPSNAESKILGPESAVTSTLQRNGCNYERSPPTNQNAPVTHAHYRAHLHHIGTSLPVTKPEGIMALGLVIQALQSLGLLAMRDSCGAVYTLVISPPESCLSGGVWRFLSSLEQGKLLVLIGHTTLIE